MLLCDHWQFPMVLVFSKSPLISDKEAETINSSGLTPEKHVEETKMVESLMDSFSFDVARDCISFYFTKHLFKEWNCYFVTLCVALGQGGIRAVGVSKLLKDAKAVQAIQ